MARIRASPNLLATTSVVTPSENWCSPRFVPGSMSLTWVDSSPQNRSVLSKRGTRPSPVKSVAAGKKQRGFPMGTVIMIAGVVIFAVGVVAGIVFIVSVGIQREERVFQE